MIDPKDVQVQHWFTKVSNTIRVTHIPTGIAAEVRGDQGYFTVKADAMALLEERLADKNRPSE